MPGEELECMGEELCSVRTGVVKDGMLPAVRAKQAEMGCRLEERRGALVGEGLLPPLMRYLFLLVTDDELMKLDIVIISE